MFDAVIPAKAGTQAFKKIVTRGSLPLGLCPHFVRPNRQSCRFGANASVNILDPGLRGDDSAHKVEEVPYA